MRVGDIHVPQDAPQLADVVSIMSTALSGLFDVAINIHAGNFALAFAAAHQTANQLASQVAPNDLTLVAEIISSLMSRGQSLAQMPGFNLAAGPLAFQLDNWGGVFGQAPGGGKFAFDGGFVSFSSGGATVSTGGRGSGEGGISAGDAPQSP